MLCDLSDLPVDQCACRIHGPKEDPPELEAPEPNEWSRLGRARPVIKSKWANKCIVCEEYWAVNDLITPLSPTSKRWIHLDCSRDA